MGAVPNFLFYSECPIADTNMKVSNILFLCLLVLFCLISCSEAGRGKKGLAKKRNGGKGKNAGVKKFKGGKKRGKGRKKVRKQKDDDEDDNKKQKRRRKGSKKRSKSGKKGKKGRGKGARKGVRKASERASEKKKGKGCRHPDNALRPGGNTLLQKVSGAVPCYAILCTKVGKKYKWVYEEQECKTCKMGDVQYMVGYVSEQKCYGPPPCYIMMCMADGQFRKQGWPCGTQSDTQTTTSSSSGKATRVYFKCTWSSKTWKSDYSDTSSSAFKSLDSSIQSKISSADISNHKSSKVTFAWKGSTGTKGYVECSGSGCSNSEVSAGLTKAGASNVETSGSSYTTTTVATTTTN